MRVGICDDEESDLEQIREVFCRKAKELDSDVRLEVELFHDGQSLYDAACRKAFDLVFLDIEMPQWDGFKLAGELSQDSPDTRLIFVSSHESWVFDAHEYMPLWFVRKGLLERDMNRALCKYFHMTACRKIRFKINDGFEIREILLRDILYIECNGHQLTVQLVGGTSYYVYGSLKPVEADLSGHGFLRVHRNYLVNQAYVREVGKEEIILKGGANLPMGRDRRKDVREAMIRYARRRNGNSGCSD